MFGQHVRPAREGESMLSPEDQAAALNAHNGWRERDNSPPFAWGNNLPAFAQDWAVSREDFSIRGKLGDGNAI